MDNNRFSGATCKAQFSLRVSSDSINHSGETGASLYYLKLDYHFETVSPVSCNMQLGAGQS